MKKTERKKQTRRRKEEGERELGFYKKVENTVRERFWRWWRTGYRGGGEKDVMIGRLS